MPIQNDSKVGKTSFSFYLFQILHFSWTQNLFLFLFLPFPILICEQKLCKKKLTLRALDSLHFRGSRAVKLICSCGFNARPPAEVAVGHDRFQLISQHSSQEQVNVEFITEWNKNLFINFLVGVYRSGFVSQSKPSWLVPLLVVDSLAWHLGCIRCPRASSTVNSCLVRPKLRWIRKSKTLNASISLPPLK